MIGFIFAVGAAVAYYPVKTFSRVSCLITGHVIMSIFHALLAVCILLEQNVLALVFIMAFSLTFQLTEGPILWIYSAEVCHDANFGIAVLAQFVFLFVISMITEFMVKYLDTYGTFFFFSGCSLAGAVFIKLAVKETHGLTDKEKKNLYRPVTGV